MRFCRYRIYSFHLEVRFQKYTFFTVLSPVLCKQEVQMHVKVTVYYWKRLCVNMALIFQW